MHRVGGKVDQVNCLAISHDKEWEALCTESREREQIGTLCFISERTFNLYQSSLLFVDKGDPGNSPAAHDKFVVGDLVNCCEHMIREKEVFRLYKFLSAIVKGGK